MTTKFKVSAEQLNWRCDLSFFPFTCTSEMTPLEDFIGQERAIRAIEFGLGVNKPGFNITALRRAAEAIDAGKFWDRSEQGRNLERS